MLPSHSPAFVSSPLLGYTLCRPLLGSIVIQAFFRLTGVVYLVARGLSLSLTCRVSSTTKKLFRRRIKTHYILGTEAPSMSGTEHLHEGVMNPGFLQICFFILAGIHKRTSASFILVMQFWLVRNSITIYVIAGIISVSLRIFIFFQIVVIL